MALSADVKRPYSQDVPPLFQEMPVDADVTIYEGSALGENASTGYVRPLADGDTFHGFAERAADNDGGSAGDINVLVRRQCSVELTSGAALDAADMNVAFYASDDGTFSKTDSGSDTRIGTTERIVSASKAMVFCQGVTVRSI